jgi:hypothetical protein
MSRDRVIYPHFIGRLGNNMFQIAACIGYAKKHNVGWGIKKGYIEKGFNTDQIDRFFPHLPACNETYRAYNEPGFTYQEIPFNPNGVRLVGFFQSIKYFENCQEDVRQAFNIKYVEGYEDHVSIHVRRGDYATNPDHFPPVTMDYVFKAWYEMTRTVNGEYFTPIFFSDDIEWCKNVFSEPFPDAIYSEGRTEYEDLCLMASCGHNIIANSSFSWWGAFLNRNPNKIVVSPSSENWFGKSNGEYGKTKDIIPDNWIQIKY